MTTLTMLKLALAIAGIAVWLYGVRADSATLRWTGTALLAVAVALRLLARRPRDGAPR